MQFVKMLLWALFLIAGFIFWWSNETRSSLDIGAAIVEGRVSTFVLAAFLLGLVPLWLVHRATKWRLNRRIKSLEAAARPITNAAQAPTATPTPPATPVSSQSTQSTPLASEPAERAEPAPSVADKKAPPA